MALIFRSATLGCFGLWGRRQITTRWVPPGLGLTVCPELTLEEKGGYSSVGCFVEDGGGPPDVGVQAQASNRHELLG